jgi:protein-tyrosine phosphatase
MAEAFMGRELTARGIDVAVSSCGLVSDGRPAEGEVIDLLAERGLDITDHRTRTMSPELVEQATVIIGMERQHVIEVVSRDESAYERTYTLPELVRRLEALPVEDEDGRAIVRTPAEALAEVSHGRTHRDLLRIIGDDEIPDPIGKSGRVFDHTADEIDELVIRLLDALWPATKRSVEPTTAVS